MCVLRMVKTLFETAGVTQSTAVAYVRRLRESFTSLHLEVFAESVTHAASSAQGIFTFRVAGRADVVAAAIKAQRTGIVACPHTADTPEHKMGADFIGDGGRIFVQGNSNCFERSFVMKHSFDCNAVV